MLGISARLMGQCALNNKDDKNTALRGTQLLLLLTCLGKCTVSQTSMSYDQQQNSTACSVSKEAKQSISTFKMFCMGLVVFSYIFEVWFSIENILLVIFLIFHGSVSLLQRHFSSQQVNQFGVLPKSVQMTLALSVMFMAKTNKQKIQ